MSFDAAKHLADNLKIDELRKLSYLEAFARYLGGDMYGSFYTRSKLVEAFAWAVPSDEAIKAIAALSPIVEVGAGSGYWAKLIHEAGGKIKAHDDYSWPKRINHGFWFPVSKDKPNLNVNCLLLCWPPMTSMAADTVKEFTGKFVAYVGEGELGCTADDAFFELMKRDWLKPQYVDIPQFWGLHDVLAIYERKP